MRTLRTRFLINHNLISTDVNTKTQNILIEKIVRKLISTEIYVFSSIFNIYLKEKSILCLIYQYFCSLYFIAFNTKSDSKNPKSGSVSVSITGKSMHKKQSNSRTTQTNCKFFIIVMVLKQKFNYTLMDQV